MPTSRVRRGRASVLVGARAVHVRVARRAPVVRVAVAAQVAAAGHKAEIADTNRAPMAPFLLLVAA